MIAALTPENTDAFLAACQQDILFGSQLRTDLLVYGGHSGVADFWLAADSFGRPTAALSRIDGRIWLAAGEAADLMEIGGFLRAVGGFDQVTASRRIAGALRLGGRLASAPIMDYRGGCFCWDYRAVTEALSLDELYRINCACFPGFRTGNRRDLWCVYTSHMIRHGFGIVAGIREGGRMAATAGAYAIGGGYGVIGCVATYPRCRGRGYGELLVGYISDRLLSMGLIPALFCAEDSLAAYYGRLGFQVCGHWTRISLGGFL